MYVSLERWDVHIIAAAYRVQRIEIWSWSYIDIVSHLIWVFDIKLGPFEKHNVLLTIEPSVEAPSAEL